MRFGGVQEHYRTTWKFSEVRTVPMEFVMEPRSPEQFLNAQASAILESQFGNSGADIVLHYRKASLRFIGGKQVDAQTFLYEHVMQGRCLFAESSAKEGEVISR